MTISLHGLSRFSGRGFSVELYGQFFDYDAGRRCFVLPDAPEDEIAGVNADSEDSE